MSASALAPLPEKSKISLLGLDRQGLEQFFVNLGEKPFRARQIMQWIYHHKQLDFSQMTNLGKSLRDRLQNEAELCLPEVLLDQTSIDGTRKWVLKLFDGNGIEVVLIPTKNRSTLCISSQVGCMLNCRFCSTARQGFNRNLTTAEIISQVMHAMHAIDQSDNVVAPLTNVVLMGMGEPLLNFDNVVRSLNILTDDLGFGLSKRRVTLSTAGVVPMSDELAKTGVSLAVSLHAVSDSIRNELVPLNKKYPISELLDACRRYVDGKNKRRVTFEYVMLDGVNDSLHDARELVRLLSGIPAKVNLIPFNPFPGAPYRCSDEATIKRFGDVLMRAGFMTIVRSTRGEDIDAACGQLVGQVIDRTRRQQRVKLSDVLPISS
jgi:23S rRNA (adenine2503-C2)-methyltransferase